MSNYVFLKGGKVALIDPSDFDRISRYEWHCIKVGPCQKAYAFTTIKHRRTSMHRLILGYMPGLEVDHINGDGLDNRRSNLRRCTRSENAWNTRGWGKKLARHTTESPQYKGVWHSSHGYTWEARCCWNRKQRYLGTFKTPMEAALAYDSAARAHHGKFARLNFPEGPELGVRQ